MKIDDEKTLAQYPVHIVRDGNLIWFTTLNSIYLKIKDKVREFDDLLKYLIEFAIEPINHKFSKNILFQLKSKQFPGMNELKNKIDLKTV